MHTMADRTLAVQFDEKKIDQIFEEVNQCELPGVAVGVAIGGKCVYRKGFGLANMELPVILSPAMRMRIGSTTKHFTSLAYLLLCEEGQAGLEDNLRTYLPELHPVTHSVTMRQLMGHVSGLRDAHDISWQFSGTGQRVSGEELLSLYQQIDDSNASPGVAWSYNNGGYLILSVAIERITGQALGEVLWERIFQPVGMHDTLLRRWDSDFIRNSATLHMTTQGGGFEKSYMGTAHCGEGGIVSTVDDMLRWLAHMDTPVVGTCTTWETMKAPQRLANGTSTGYGLGLIASRYRGVDTLSHPGGVMGGNSQMLKVPGAGLDIVIMANRHDVLGMLLVDRILDACLPDLDPVGEASASPPVSGVFRSPTTGRIIQLFDKDGLQIASIDGDDLPFVPDDDGTLRPAAIWAFIKHEVRLAGDVAKPRSIEFSDFGTRDDLIKEPPPLPDSVTGILGTYRSETTATQAAIGQLDDGPRLTTVGRFGSATYRLECLADRIWRAKALGVMQWGGVLSFDPDGAAFRYTTSRTRSLIFRRIA
jgi:D-aminopeptidase